MNVLFVSISWPAPSDRNLYSDLMGEFVARGHNVFVASAADRVIQGLKPLNKEKGMTVLRVLSGKIRKTSPVRKAISLLFLDRKISNAISTNFSDIQFDLIISHTPPITLSGLFRKLKRKHNTPFYLLLKDIWPQGSVDNKFFSKYSLPWFYLRYHEISIYKTASKIGCMSPFGVEYLLDKNNFLKPEKLEVCPNAIKPTENFSNIDHESIRKKYGIPTDACVFIFSGNLGKGHGLYFLVEAIKKLSTYPKVFFLIGGSGTHFQFLENAFKEYSGGNVLLYSWLPAEDFNQIMKTSDVGLILLDKCYSVPQFPSRMLSYLDFSKPVLCAINQSTDIGSIVEEAGCGKSLLHGDLNGFKEAIRFFAGNKEEREKMGKNARQLLLEKYTTQKAYITIIHSLK